MSWAKRTQNGDGKKWGGGLGLRYKSYRWEAYGMEKRIRWEKMEHKWKLQQTLKEKKKNS